MKDFNLEINEWYSLRDDRTRRVNGVSGFENFSLGVIIGADADRTSIQSTALVALNILSRWCRKIRIQIDSSINLCIPNRKGQNFISYLKQLMFNADPYGEFSFGNVIEKDFDQILIIGQTEKSFRKPCIYITGVGWVAGVSFGKPCPPTFAESDCIVGPAFAACLGVAEIFRQAIGLTPPDRYTSYYSLYDFSNSESQGDLYNPIVTDVPEFGRIYQIGCGAVGSSLDFLLSLTNWKASIQLIDDDKVDFTNCNRSMAFGALEAYAGRRKVDVCADILNSSHFSSDIFNGKYNDFVRTGRCIDSPPDIILCLANEDAIWSTIQNNLPPFVLHATTTPNWGLNFGRHIPKKEWCILCRFSNDIKHSFTPVCGEGILESNDRAESIQGVLPFLSPAASVLILAEMAKMCLDEYPISENFVQFSMKDPQNTFLRINRGPDSKCLCNDQSTDFYPAQIRNGRFWQLSN